MCWHPERTGLELRLKSMNGARVRPRPPLCIIAFKVSKPYHEQRAHLLMQRRSKAKMRTKVLSFGPSSGLRKSSKTVPNVLSTFAAHRWSVNSGSWQFKTVLLIYCHWVFLDEMDLTASFTFL